jgi:dephospho-CoA kinase
MFLIGLTGGIASGKSTVAARWVQHGAIEVDADLIAREVVAPGSEGLRLIVEQFGDSVLKPDGSLDRTKLGSIVFQDQLKLIELNSIVHPLVRIRTQEILKSLPEKSIAIYNVPLLVEANVDHNFDMIVTVEAPEGEQIKRMQLHRNMSAEEAKSRIASQVKPIERVSVADQILNSNQDMNLLIRDADQLWLKIEKLASDKNNG